MIKDFKDENYLNDEYVYNMGRKISNIIYNDYMRNWTKIKVIDNLEEGKEHG